MAERRQRPATAALGTGLIDFWRGDPSEVIAGFLPLPAIATMPRLSRRFRNQHPTIIFALARRHNVANAVNVASLDALAASGRDWWTFSPSPEESFAAWKLLPPETSPRFPNGSDKRFTCSMQAADGLQHMEISTEDNWTGDTSRPYGGGLVKCFDPRDRLCVRRVKYRFSFTDPTPEESHGDLDEHAFAYVSFTRSYVADQGLYVCPTSTGYALRGLVHDYSRLDDESDDESNDLRVEPDTWYEVEAIFDWTRDCDSNIWVEVVLKGQNGYCDRKRFTGSRDPLGAVQLFNYSPGVARYSAIEVQYSAYTSRDGQPFADWQLKPLPSY
jgi:hypothetical protein